MSGISTEKRSAKRPTHKLTFRRPLDRDVYQILKKLESSEGSRPTSVPALYEAIKRSNSSLARQKKRPLEDAIERALQIRKQEERQDASDDSEAAIDVPEPAAATEGGFLLNRQMTQHWKMNQRPNGEQAIAKKRRRQADGGDNDERGSGPESTAKAPSKQTGLGAQTQQKSNRCIIEKSVLPGLLAGYDQLCSELTLLVAGFLQSPDHFRNVRNLVQGILLSGPHGVGKMTLVRNLAARCAVPLISLTPCFTDLDRTEKSLSEAFDMALILAPCILFIKDIEECLPRPASSGYSEPCARAAYHFVKQMARISKGSGHQSRVFVLATTSRTAEINPAVTKFGLFAKTYQMRVPNCIARREILEALIKDTGVSDDVDLDEIAKITHGYVGVDLAAIVSEAGSRVARRFAVLHDDDADGESNPLLRPDDRGLREWDSVQSLDSAGAADPLALPTSCPSAVASETMEDFRAVINGFTPSLRKEGFTVIPSVTWDQVGALDKARRQLQTSIIGPIKKPDLYRGFGLKPTAGVLLWGPPGCGKTLIAQAVANEAQASFILIDGPELLNKYVGESERAVRELFQRARSSTPCILFFDEIDSIVPARNKSSTESGARVVNALLAELDGVKDRTGIYVIGTTNRPDMIDEAILRPGRLNVQLLIDMPTASERVDILRAIYRTCMEHATDEAVERLAAVALDGRCTNFSGADLSGLHTKAAEHALEAWEAAGGVGPHVIGEQDWEFALANTRASVRNIESYTTRTNDFM